MKPVSLRSLVDAYLNQDLSRRAFVSRMASWGFSAAAATSLVESLRPLVDAEALAAGPSDGVSIVEGTGGKLLVEQLRAAGVRFVFNCNSSGTYPIFDALLDTPDVHVIEVPQEGQMVSIAQGYALASGEIPFTVNDSVGMPNTLNNMYNAWRDRTPLLITSQREERRVQGGRDTAQEWDDFLSPTTSFTRWRWSIDEGGRIPEIVRRAFKIASTPPAGPVALAFPDDVLAAPQLKGAILQRDKFILKPELKASPALIEETAQLLLEARSPVLMVGPEITRSGGQKQAIALAEALSLPVVEGERLFDDFPTNHPLFLGKYRKAGVYPEGVDLVLNLGSRLTFEDEDMIPSGTKLVHVGIDPSDIGRVIPADVGIVAGSKEVASDLVLALDAAAARARVHEIRTARQERVTRYTDAQRTAREKQARAQWDMKPLSWDRVGGELNQLLDQDAIVVPELSPDTWVSGQFGFAPGGRSKIGRTTGSALGWGVGAAIGVKLAQPNRQVLSILGDGAFLFGQGDTLWTMARYDVPVLVVVMNNRSYNGPRDSILSGNGAQARAGKEMTSYLGSPDVEFARLAAAYGVRGETVEAPDQVRPAIERAIASTRDGRPYLLDMIVGRTGRGADSTWHPRYSVAEARTKRV